VWISGIPGRAKMQPSVEVKLKARASPVRVKQCPLRICDYRKRKETTDNFWSLDYSSNRIVACTHSVVANPYTLLSELRNE